MRLIINADDFGFSEVVNEDIILCHQFGTVTSTTILAGGKAFSHAIVLAKQNPKLAIGVHLAIDGALNIGSNYKSLLDPDTGSFYKDVEIIKKIRNAELDRKELVEEYSLQIEKVRNAGIKITHLDHHHHLHLYFPILNAVIEVAKKYQIPFIRSQKLLFSQNPNFLKQIYRKYHQGLLAKKHHTTTGYASLLECHKETMLTKVQHILSVKNQVVELVVHPSKENAELEFLTQKRTLDVVKNYLISYGDLAQNHDISNFFRINIES